MTKRQHQEDDGAEEGLLADLGVVGLPLIGRNLRGIEEKPACKELRFIVQKDDVGILNSVDDAAIQMAKMRQKIPYVLMFWYIAAYIVLDRISFLHPFSEVGITPWDPPAGLTLAFLLHTRMRCVAAVPIAVLAAELLVRRLAVPWLPTTISVAITAAGYSAAGYILVNAYGIDPGLRRLSDTLRFVTVGVVAAFVIAFGVVSNYAGFGLVPLEEFWAAVLRSWIGDFVGILTLAPAILVLSSGDLAWRIGTDRRGGVRQGGEIFLHAVGIIATVAFIFGFDFPEELKLFYVLFLPIMWVAVRHGLGGAAFGILLTQIALKVAFQSQGFTAKTVIDFQMLMLALGLTGLFVGAIVSERRKASELLRESEGRLKAILRTAPDAILTVDDFGLVESANPAVEEMFGWPERHLIGLPIARILPNVTLGQRYAQREMPGARRNGTSFPAEVALGMTIIADRPRHIAVVRDVTRRVEAETLLRQHQVELAHVDRVSLVGEMASAIAHEESQPLAAIAAYTRACRLLLQAPQFDPKKVSEALEKVAAQTVRAGDVLNRLRQFLHRGELEAVPTPAADLVQEVAEFTRTDLDQRGISLIREIPSGLPRVMADRIHIQQVMLNLVRNAVDAMDETPRSTNQITIRCRRLEGRIEFEFQDTGPGLDPAVAERLFKPFTSTKDKGMGLGLSISRTIVEAHGGQLRHIPGDAPGALFRFDLPVVDEAPTDSLLT